MSNSNTNFSSPANQQGSQVKNPDQEARGKEAWPSSSPDDQGKGGQKAKSGSPNERDNDR